MVGDYISLDSGTSTPITDTLTSNAFEIVGIVESPFYMSIEKGTSEIGSGSVQFFMYLLQDDFVNYASENPYFIEAAIKFKDSDNYPAYSEEYEKYITDASAPLENLGLERSEIRLENIKKMEEKITKQNSKIETYKLRMV